MEGSVRIGTVQSINGRQVRVFFPDVGIMSGWLTVLKRKPTVTGEATVSLAEWMPAIGDSVLCLYVSGFNADGYVLGGL